MYRGKSSLRVPLGCELRCRWKRHFVCIWHQLVMEAFDAVLLVSADQRRDKDSVQPYAIECLLTALNELNVKSEGVPFNMKESNSGRGLGETIATEMCAKVHKLRRESASVLIGFSCYVWNISAMEMACRRMKEEFKEDSSVKFVVGGPEIGPEGELCAGKQIPIMKLADFVVRGYGEERLKSLVRRGNLDKSPRLFTEDNFVDMSSEILRSGREYVKLETKRGCPYRCSFCQHPGGISIPVRKPKNILEAELSAILQSKCQEICVIDPTFLVDNNDFFLLERLAHAKFGGKISLQIRYERLTQRFVDLCAQLPGICLELGVQSLEKRELQAVNRLFQPDRLHKSIELLQEQHVQFELSLICGLPHQTLLSFRENHRKLQELGIEKKNVRTWRLMLLRGTKLHDEKDRLGLVEKTEKNGIAYVVSTPTMTESDMRDCLVMEW